MALINHLDEDLEKYFRFGIRNVSFLNDKIDAIKEEIYHDFQVMIRIHA
jgi:hypothetical protein